MTTITTSPAAAIASPTAQPHPGAPPMPTQTGTIAGTNCTTANTDSSSEPATVPTAGTVQTPFLTTPAEFCQVAEQHLGRANGNMYQRHAAVPRVNDGQVMVRLKKKRFVVLDYTVIPTETDLQYLRTTRQQPHLPPFATGAGKTLCQNSQTAHPHRHNNANSSSAAPPCSKIGVPVVLYDSHPEETASLYVRSGLCFECQRNLNEKRRVDRKRVRPPPADADSSLTIHKDGRIDSSSNPAANHHHGSSPPSLLYALGPCPKRLKMEGSQDTVQLKRDAVIINGAPTADTKSVAAGYGHVDLGVDLQLWTRQGLEDVAQLLQHAAEGQSSSLPPKTMILTNSLYEKAFVSLNKAIFLLSQWKTSWDATTAANTMTEASAETGEHDTSEAMPPPPPTTTTALHQHHHHHPVETAATTDALVAAVDTAVMLEQEAAAAAAAAAANDDEEAAAAAMLQVVPTTNSSMASLLLAADAKEAAAQEEQDEEDEDQAYHHHSIYQQYHHHQQQPTPQQHGYAGSSNQDESSSPPPQQQQHGGGLHSTLYHHHHHHHHPTDIGEATSPLQYLQHVTTAAAVAEAAAAAAAADQQQQQHTQDEEEDDTAVEGAAIISSLPHHHHVNATDNNTNTTAASPTSPSGMTV